MNTKTKAIIYQLPRRRARSLRPFLTQHFANGRLVRQTFAATLASAVRFSVDHLWRDSYGATRVLISDRRSENVIALITKKGSVITTRRIA